MVMIDEFTTREVEHKLAELELAYKIIENLRSDVLNLKDENRKLKWQLAHQD
jgi:DNA integrity scanning protein DisA with diadenylate cyclase activity